ncbi:hypothetical protein J4416_01075 [Candidatus Pacearchaeota archaeon]|nr:hypothetical protein [Candidatus Pacearchaeota archaeon]HLC73146.1 hypothetical protein [Candidatus Nanoarchaeia archaeon]
MRKIVLFLLLVLVLPFVSSFGVTPAQRVFGYEPGTEQKFSFEIINSEGKTFNLKIVPQGELNKSVIMSTYSVSFTPDVPSVKIDYSVRVPLGLDPGRHTADILVIEDSDASNSDSENTFIGSVIGIITKVVIDVPYPGKYLESSLNINSEKNGKIVFTLPLVSKGDLDIIKANAEIEIFSPLGKKVISLSTNELPVPSLARRELTASLDTSAIDPGSYKAIATVFYDKSELIFEKEFFVGGGGLAIKNIKVDTKNFKLGGIVKFEFLVENKLNLPVDEAYVKMQVFDDKGNAFSEFKSATYDIDSFGSKSLIAFWDTKDVRVGLYDAKVSINSDQEPIEAQLSLDVSENDIVVIGTGYVIKSSSGFGNNTLVTVLVIAIVVLVLLNLVWFLVLRRRIKSKH